NRAGERLSKKEVTMLRSAGRLLALVVLALGPGVAVAQQKQAAPPPKAAAAAAAGDVQYKSKTVYDFDDDIVEGDLIRPEGELVDTRKGAKHSSLIKIRPHFVPEMLKSAEDI